MKRLLILFSLLIFLIPVKGQFLRTGSAYTKNIQAAGNDFLTNLVAYWALEEESGTINDAVGDNNSTGCDADYGSTGINGNCLSFTGANSDDITFADATDLRMYDQDFTFVAWIYPTLRTAYNHAGIIGGETNSAGMVMYGESGYLRLELVNSTDGTIGPSISIDAWHMVAITFNSTETTNNVTYYLDGATATISFNYDFGSDRGSIYVGKTASTSGYFTGLIDEVMIWKSRKLTTDELDDLYNSGTGLFFADFN